jgi:flagellar hook-associated protein 1 FlgK
VAPAASSGPVQAPYIGLANRIAVNPAVVANPALVRDGTAGGASAASSETVIDAVLSQAFGPASASSAAPPNLQGLGLSGTLRAGFAQPQSLLQFATDIVATQTAAASAASTDLDNAQAVQQTFNKKLAAVAGVSVDQEMSTMIGLQNAYAANARIITAAQQMWNALLAIGGG